MYESVRKYGLNCSENAELKALLLNKIFARFFPLWDIKLDPNLRPGESSIFHSNWAMPSYEIGPLYTSASLKPVRLGTLTDSP